MKVCVYVEYEETLRKYGDTGIRNSAVMARQALRSVGVEVTDDPDGDYDIIDINPVAFVKARSVLKRARKKGKRVAVHVHTTPENFRNSFWFADAVAPFVDRQMKKLYREADGLVCVSNHVSATLEAMGIGGAKHVVGNCFESRAMQAGDREAYRKKYGLEGVVPFSVGLVIPRKGIETFVNVARTSKLKFIWYGAVSGGLATSFKGRKIARDAPQNVTFAGYVDNINDAYASGDIFFFPSLNETFGIVILEAMTAGKPVLVRDMPVYDWIKGGSECLKAADDADFSAKLEMLANDTALRSRLAAAGRARAAEYSFAKTGERLKKAFGEIMAS